VSTGGPVLRVVRGDATPEEIAALLVVLARSAPAAGGQPRRAGSTWAERGALLRRLPAAGPGAWRASGLPH
jgi:hypothetical protein